MSRSRSHSRSESRSRSRSRSQDDRKEPATKEVAEVTDFRVYARGFPSDSVESEVREFFEGCGTITDFAVRSRTDGTFCFITYQNLAGYQAAIALNGQAYKGSTLVVEPRTVKNCFYCKKPGHVAGQCPIRPQNQQGRMQRDRRGGAGGNNNRGGDRARTCFNCGGEGHLSRECPSGRGGRRVDQRGGAGDGRRGGSDRGGDRKRDRSRSRRRSDSRRRSRSRGDRRRHSRSRSRDSRRRRD